MKFNKALSGTVIPERIYIISSILIISLFFALSSFNSSCINPHASSPDDTVKNSNNPDSVLSDNTLSGTWGVDQAFNEPKMQINISRGLSYRWQKSLTFSNDTFYLEEWEWWPPRHSDNGIEYLPYEGENYFKGTFLYKNDSLILYGRNTDYKYSYIDYEFHIERFFLFKIHNDTLLLTDELSRNYQLIRKFKK